MKIMLFALIIVSCTTSVIASAAQRYNLGKSLFYDNTIGTTGNSCATCHPDGKKLDEINEYEDDILKEMINFCIRDALKGEMLETDSTELNSLLNYLRGLKN